MISEGTYIIEQAFGYVLEIDYDYYWLDGDHETPPESDLTVTEVRLNGMEIKSFYFDFIEEQIAEQLDEYAQENKNR
jgi:hypothetical protein